MDDHSAMVAYAGQSGLAWARCVDDAWAEQGSIDSRPFVAAHPRLRLRPSGGLWMLWTEYLRVHVSSYRDGAWFRGDSLVCIHPDGGTYASGWCDASRDTAERPVLVWSDFGYGYTYRDVACIAWPTDGGWTAGEEIPGSEQNATLPVVTRDLNGDAWVAWSPIGVGGDYYTHTYNSATCGAPHLGAGRALAWTLSGPAPETWWAVLKSVNGGDYAGVARVRAGPSVEMSWNDPDPPAAPTSYKIRRECVDTRYVWESPAVTVGPGSRPPIYLGPPTGAPSDPDSEPATPEDRQWGRVRLSLGAAAPGPVVVRVYDLQGRLILEQRVTAQGTDRVAIALDFRQARQPLPSGVYFARASDEAGNSSATVRVVLLR
jgi:hypothetical protein